MRKLQNLYFNEKSDKTKADWLRRAKVTQREFFQLVREFRQRSLFTREHALLKTFRESTLKKSRKK